MLAQLCSILFPKPKLTLYPDDMPDTIRYHAVTERSKPWWDREGIDPDCSISKARPSLYIDYFTDGPMVLNVEIGRKVHRKR